MRIRLPLLALLGLGWGCAGLPEDDDEPEGPIAYNRHIRPLIADACFQCHGPDPSSRKAKLRFDREEGFFAAREGGPTVVPGQPEKSPLYLRLVSADPDEVMPPPDSHRILKPRHRERIRRWIALAGGRSIH